MGRDTPGPNGSVRARRHAACRAGAEKRRREREATGASNASPVARHEEDERRARHLMCTEGGRQQRPQEDVHRRGHCEPVGPGIPSTSITRAATRGCRVVSIQPLKAAEARG